MIYYSSILTVVLLVIEKTSSCMFRVLTCSEQSSHALLSLPQASSPKSIQSLECSCIRPPLPNTIQAFGEEIESFVTDSITHVSFDNCSAPHYNMRIRLGNEDIAIHTCLLRNFLSAKFILEGEIKDNISIQIENFIGSFGNVLGHVELTGVLRCFNDSKEESNKSRLKISFNNVDSILISNFYVKDPDNACVVEIESSGTEDFSVTRNKFKEGVKTMKMSHKKWSY